MVVHQCPEGTSDSRAARDVQCHPVLPGNAHLRQPGESSGNHYRQQLKSLFLPLFM